MIAKKPRVEEEEEAAPRTPEQHPVHQSPEEALVGTRVRLKQKDFLSSKAEFENDEREAYLLGTCEAYSPSRRAVLVVFDEPFGHDFDKFRRKGDKSGTKPLPKRLSVALWNKAELYLQYDSGAAGWGGCCTVKKSRSKRRACYWWGAWVPVARCLAEDNQSPLEPLLCLCRRVEVAEPPPPLLIRASLIPRLAEEDDADKSALVECESCKEWFHADCAGIVARRVPNTDEMWRCPLCENTLKTPRLKEKSAQIGPPVSQEKLSTWFHESQQPLWRSCAPVQWQWWPNAFDNDIAGEWVLALCSLRRFVTTKSIDEMVSKPNSKVVSMWRCLNNPLIEDADHDPTSAHLNWALLMDELRRVRPSVPILDDLLETGSVGSTGAAELKSLASSVKTSSRSSISRVRAIPSKMRSFEEHMEILDAKRSKSMKRSYRRQQPQAASLSSGGAEDCQGRNQRLEIRRVASAVGESALTIGRRRRLRFGRSPIHMWGVFADEPFGAGDFVAEYKGELITQKETDRRFNEYVMRGMPDYLFKIDSNLFCDATLKGSLARFINHSCEPNCEAKIILHQNQKKIALYAVRDIAVGEELCYDYKFPIEEGIENKIPCNCGSKKCRKVMN